MKKFIALPIVVFALASIVGCSQEQVTPQVIAPSVEPTPSPGQIIAQELSRELSASPSEIIISLQDGKELWTLSQAQGYSNDSGIGIETLLNKLEKDFVSDRISGIASSSGKKRNVEFRKLNNFWTVSIFEQSVVISQSGFIERIQQELLQELTAEGQQLQNPFFFVTFRGNGEPFDVHSGEIYLNQLFTQKGFSHVVELTATLRGRTAAGEERKAVRDYRISLAMTKK